MGGTTGRIEVDSYRGEKLQTRSRSIRDSLATKEGAIFLLFVLPNFFFPILFTCWPMWENIRLREASA